MIRIYTARYARFTFVPLDLLNPRCFIHFSYSKTGNQAWRLLLCHSYRSNRFFTYLICLSMNHIKEMLSGSGDGAMNIILVCQWKKHGTSCVEHTLRWTGTEVFGFNTTPPKFSFTAGIAIQNRFPTRDRISQWNRGVLTLCGLCKTKPETKTITADILKKFGKISHTNYCPRSIQKIENL